MGSCVNTNNASISANNAVPTCYCGLQLTDCHDCHEELWVCDCCYRFKKIVYWCKGKKDCIFKEIAGGTFNHVLCAECSADSVHSTSSPFQKTMLSLDIIR